jgi:hypothetical protein
MSISGPSGANALYDVYATSEQHPTTQIPTARSFSVPAIFPFPGWPAMPGPVSSSIRPPGGAAAKPDN